MRARPKRAEARCPEHGAPAEGHDPASGWPALLLQSQLGLTFGFYLSRSVKPLAVGSVSRWESRPALSVPLTRLHWPINSARVAQHLPMPDWLPPRAGRGIRTRLIGS